MANPFITITLLDNNISSKISDVIAAKNNDWVDGQVRVR